MSSRPTEAVVFDLGGVLIDWDPRYLYRKIFSDSAAMEEFLSTVCTAEWNHRQDEGRLWEDAVAELSQRFPAHRTLIHAYWHRWDEMMRGCIEDTVAVVAELKLRGVRLYALTNFSTETFPVARSRFDFLEWFEGIVVSGEEGVAKPSPRIFQILLDRYALQPESIVFVDDRIANVEMARSLGIKGHHFQNSRLLRQYLRGIGIFGASVNE